MFSKLTQFLFIVFLFLSFTRESVATNSPEETVKLAISTVKNPKETANVVNYVYWPSVFAKLTQSGKRQLKVYTPDQFRNLVYKFLQDPSAVIKIRANDYKNSMPPVMAQPLDQLAQDLTQKALHFRKQLQTSKYEITKTQINDTDALVIVKTTTDGQTSPNKLKLIRVNGQWLFSDMALASKFTSAFDPLATLGNNLGIPQ